MVKIKLTKDGIEMKVKIMFDYSVDDNLKLSLPNPEVDSYEIFDLINDNRESLKKYLPWVDNMLSYQDERKVMRMNLINFSRNLSLNLIIKLNNQSVGTISFNSIDKNNRSADIGYWLAPEFEKQGIIARSLSAMCKIGFEEFNLNKIVINAAVDNEKSNHVAKRAGFQLDGTLREKELLSDGFHDEHQWSILKRKWTKDE